MAPSRTMGSLANERKDSVTRSIIVLNDCETAGKCIKQLIVPFQLLTSISHIQ